MKCFGAITGDETNCNGDVRAGERSEFITGPLRLDAGYCDFHRYTRNNAPRTKRSPGFKSLAGRPLPVTKDGQNDE